MLSGKINSAGLLLPTTLVTKGQLHVKGSKMVTPTSPGIVLLPLQ
jgi:hypothetical protein